MSIVTEARRTFTVEEARQLLGVSRYLAYEEIARTGAFAGVPIIRVGQRILIPRVAFERVVDGIDDSTIGAASVAEQT